MIFLTSLGNFDLSKEFSKNNNYELVISFEYVNLMYANRQGREIVFFTIDTNFYFFSPLVSFILLCHFLLL